MFSPNCEFKVSQPLLQPGKEFGEAVKGPSSCGGCSGAVRVGVCPRLWGCSGEGGAPWWPPQPHHRGPGHPCSPPSLQPRFLLGPSSPAAPAPKGPFMEPAQALAERGPDPVHNPLPQDRRRRQLGAQRGVAPARPHLRRRLLPTSETRVS